MLQISVKITVLFVQQISREKNSNKARRAGFIQSSSHTRKAKSTSI